jgi:hypothetical protein
MEKIKQDFQKLLNKLPIKGDKNTRKEYLV